MSMFVSYAYREREDSNQQFANTFNATKYDGDTSQGFVRSFEEALEREHDFFEVKVLFYKAV